MNQKTFWLRLSSWLVIGFLAWSQLILPTAQAASLGLSGKSAPAGTIKLETDDNGALKNHSGSAISGEDANDQLIQTLVGTGTNGLIGNLIKIIKYILGGVFMLFFGLYVINLITNSQEESGRADFKKQAIWAFVGFAIMMLADPIAAAFNPFGKDGGSFLTDAEQLKASGALALFSMQAAVRFLQYLLGSIALIFMSISALQIITAPGGGGEEDIKNSRKMLVWSTLGLLFAIGVTQLVQIFVPENPVAADPLQAHAELLKSGWTKAHILVASYVKYFEVFMGAIAIFTLFLAGFKMVTAGGDEEMITKQRKMITWVFMGLSTIMIAEIFVNIFLPKNEQGQISFESKQAIQTFADAMGGFTNFFLAFSGSLAVLSLIAGALMLSSAAANAEQAEKAKKILVGSALGLVITISAYALVNTVLSGL